jgi:hypothetical protein
MPSFFPKGGFKGASCSGGTFFKEQGDGFPGKALAYFAPLFFGLYLFG